VRRLFLEILNIQKTTLKPELKLGTPVTPALAALRPTSLSLHVSVFFCFRVNRRTNGQDTRRARKVYWRCTIPISPVFISTIWQRMLCVCVQLCGCSLVVLGMYLHADRQSSIYLDLLQSIPVSGPLVITGHLAKVLVVTGVPRYITCMANHLSWPTCWWWRVSRCQLWVFSAVAARVSTALASSASSVVSLCQRHYISSLMHT